VFQEIGYDAASRILQVRFNSGRVYRYSHVPQEVFEWLLRVPSKGAFFNRMIRDGYVHTEVVEPEPESDALAAQLRASLKRDGM
jgi:hypothetical protein